MTAKPHPAQLPPRIVCLVMLAIWSPGLAVADDGIEFFEKRIRPVLVEHCYKCHSAKSKKLMGKLRLDSKAGWQRGGESGEPAIAPGRPNESPLIRAVRHEEDVSAMPPGKARLSQRIIDDLTAWVRRGAPDPRDQKEARADTAGWDAEFRRRLDWWSLRPVADVAPPAVAGNWSDKPVDRFILRGLQRKRLTPAADADALTLLRRLSFVLTGLPPSPKNVNTFPARFAEDPEKALAEIVDELLQSPHFGERIARHWMDVVRYTDTYGYEWDNPAKGSWEYRDYLIRAFNRDIGFDQLVREQIAGDLLPNPRVDSESGLHESLIGPMFFHMGEHRHGDNEQINGVREEMIDNKIDAFSKAFLATTIACARCHDHKFDAIAQSEYYSLAGVFMTPRWTARSIEDPNKNAAAIAELKRLREAIRKHLSQRWTRDAVRLASGETLQQWAVANRSSLAAAKLGDIAWIFKRLLTGTTWLKSTDLSVKAAAESTELVIEKSGSILARGDVPESDTYTVTFNTGPGTVGLLRLEALTHDSLGSRGPGRTPHGNFVLSQMRVSVKPFAAPAAAEGDAKAAAREVVLASARADYSQPNYPVADALKPSKSKGWGVGLGGNVDRTAWFTFAKPVDLKHGGEWTVILEHGYGAKHSLGRFRITPGVEGALPKSASERRAQDEATIAAWRELDGEWRKTSESRRKANAETFTRLTDFSQPEWPKGWIIDGDGLRNGYVAGGEPLISLEGETAVQRLLPRGYHTHALSSKLPGALRLPAQQDLPGQRVSVLLAGDQWSGYLRIADNAFQTEHVKFFARKKSAWQALADVSAKNGIQRVAHEIATSDLNPNFPPRTGVATAAGVKLPDNDEGFDKRSWFSVTGIVSHDKAGSPADDLRRFEFLFEAAPPANAQEAWRRIGGWLARSVTNGAKGRADNDDVMLVNWLLTQGLLPNSLSNDPELAGLIKQYRRVEASLPFPRTANSMDERGVTPVNYAMNIRGDIDVRGEKVPRGFPKMWSGQPTAARLKAPANASGRLQLAEFLVDRRHGWTARVYVNRLWQWVFGDALVRTPNDFGHLGEQPSHPELLDYLTREFTADRWSTKRLIRRLVLSRTFRQSGRVSPRAAAADPGNRWRHHYATRRLEAEAIRDALLAASGRLDRKLFGRPINPRRHVEDAKKRLFSGPADGNGRRAIYLEVSIMDRSKFLQSFNAPDPKLPTGRRDVTNGPAQALVMLNDPFVLAMAEHWANQLVRDGKTSVRARIRAMFIQALGRPPQDEEAARWESFLQTLASDKGKLLSDRGAWRHAVHTIFNTQEFIHYK